MVVEEFAHQLSTYLAATTELMQVLARACGHVHLSGFTPEDLTTWKREIADLTGVTTPASPDQLPEVEHGAAVPLRGGGLDGLAAGSAARVVTVRREVRGPSSRLRCG